MNIEEDRNQAVDTDLSGEKKDSRDLKFGNEVFSKYQDWDLTLTGNHESNDNVNNGRSFNHNYKIMMVIPTNDGVFMLNI